VRRSRWARRWSGCRSATIRTRAPHRGGCRKRRGWRSAPRTSAPTWPARPGSSRRRRRRSRPMVDAEVEVVGVSRGTLGRQERGGGGEGGGERGGNVIRTAAGLWGERGFDAVTVEEICSEAGVGRTTFYLHFESKERLLGSLAGATSAGVAADLDAARSSASL